MSQKHVDLVMWVHNNDQNNEHLPVLTEMLERITESGEVLELQSATINLQKMVLGAQKEEILKLAQELNQLRGGSR